MLYQDSRKNIDHHTYNKNLYWLPQTWVIKTNRLKGKIQEKNKGTKDILNE